VFSSGALAACGIAIGTLEHTYARKVNTPEDNNFDAVRVHAPSTTLVTRFIQTQLTQHNFHFLHRASKVAQTSSIRIC
jgi:hypothetical protein